MRDEYARGAAVAALLCALCGLFVLGGAGWPTPARSPPSYEDLDRNYGTYVGQDVEMGGTVVETDPVVVELGYDTGVFEESTYRLRLAGAPPADVGDGVYFYGELRPDRTVAVDADRTVVRQPWEVQYMYLVSVLAVLGIAARLVDGWRLRLRGRPALVPRERSLVRRLLTRGERDA